MLPRLYVSSNRRFLVRADGAPFFWLGDTAWELFHRLSREEATTYLDNRQAKGFNVVQAVALAERDGLRVPNANGDLPLHGLDPTRPNDAYFAHVDTIIEAAAARGIYTGLLPTWGDKVNPKQGGQGPVIFNPDNAYAYGRYLGQRYHDHTSIIWVLGGDRNEITDDHDSGIIWRQMAAGIASAYATMPLMTYHPRGPFQSSESFHYDDWLGLNMLQSGHGQRDYANWAMITADYQRVPVKPVLDGEPNYEDIPVGFNPENGYFTAHDVRKAAYRGVFAGGCGHTYGHNSVWQMHREGEDGLIWPLYTWQDALDRPGAGQMIHLRRLLESRPFLTRIPDQSLLAGLPGEGDQHKRATRDAQGRCAMIYMPDAETVEIDLSPLAGETIRVWWYDPRNGKAHAEGDIPKSATHKFTPPADAPDWVLVLDDAAAGFPEPGQKG